MVSRKTKKRKTIDFSFIALFLLMLVIAVLVYFIYLNNYNQTHQYDETAVSELDAPEEVINPEQEETQPEEIKETIIPVSFQNIVDEWAKSVSGNRSVVIFDLDRNEYVGSFNPNEKYSTASLYKLFVVYEGYKRVESGEWSPDELAGSTGYTVLKCLDLAIRESYSPCAETLWKKIGRNELNDIVKTNFGANDTSVSDLISTPEDILKIMKIFYSHNEIKREDLINTMKDSFLNQPSTTYNWRQGLPSGFAKANVYNKVGWEWNGSSWNIYHDAAIIEFPDQNRHFVVVVMTNRVPFQKIKELGAKIENAFYAQINN